MRKPRKKSPTTFKSIDAVRIAKLLGFSRPQVVEVFRQLKIDGHIKYAQKGTKGVIYEIVTYPNSYAR
jgi:predicted transcriptional regulator